MNTSPELISEIAGAVHITELKPGKYESEAMLRRKFGEHFTLFRQGTIRHVNEYPTMHYFGNPERT